MPATAPKTNKSTLSGSDQKRNHRLLKFIQQQTGWSFSAEKAEQFFNTLPIKIGEKQKYGISLGDYIDDGDAQHNILKYLTGTITQRQIINYLQSLKTEHVQTFARNNAKANNQYRGRDRHDKPNILELIEAGQSTDKIVQDNYGYLHNSDILYLTEPLNQIDGVVVLYGQTQLNKNVVQSQLKDNKLVIVPVNKDTGNHWTLRVFVADAHQKMSEIEYKTLTNGFCGDSAIRGAYKSVLENADKLSLDVPSNVKEIYKKIEPSVGNTNGLRQGVVEATQYLSDVEKTKSTEKHKSDIVNDPDSRHQTSWVIAISGYHSRSSESHENFFKDKEVLEAIENYKTKREKSLESQLTEGNRNMTSFACSFYRAAEIVKENFGDINKIKNHLKEILEAGEELSDEVLEIAQRQDETDSTLLKR